MSTRETTSHESMDDNTVEKNRENHDNSRDDSELPIRIIFQVFNTKTHQLEPYGSMRWNGDEWQVEEDNKYRSINCMTKETYGFGGCILTKQHRDFYKPFWHTPPTGWRVDVYPVPPQYRKDKKVETSRSTG